MGRERVRASHNRVNASGGGIAAERALRRWTTRTECRKESRSGIPLLAKRLRGASRGASAFPKLRVVALLEQGTQVLWHSGEPRVRAQGNPFGTPRPERISCGMGPLLRPGKSTAIHSPSFPKRCISRTVKRAPPASAAMARTTVRTFLPAKHRYETKNERGVCRGDYHKRCERHPPGHHLAFSTCCFQCVCHVLIAPLFPSVASNKTYEDRQRR